MSNFLLVLAIVAASLLHEPEDPHRLAIEWSEAKLQTMTLDEKVGQLLMIAAYSNRNRKYEESVRKLVQKYNIGGIVFFQGDPDKQVKFTNELQKAAKYPLLIGLDAEHGVGWRLESAMEFPQMLTNGAIVDDSLLFRMGAAIARHCKTIGVHINFAPDVDINTNAVNPVIGMRSFGENKEKVYRKGLMYARGLMSENVLPVAKHFPGHGNTYEDSHKLLPILNQSYEELNAVELYPFRKLIKADIPAIMIAHLHVPALDSANIPATLSPRVINYWLKNQLNFKGIVFTDAMNMRGVTGTAPPGEVEVKALMAGADVLIVPEDVDKAIKTIKQAIDSGLISETDINEKCKKILITKYEYVLPHPLRVRTDSLRARLNRVEDIALKNELYKQAVTLLKNTDNFLPLKRLDTLRIASVNFSADTFNTFQLMLSQYAEVAHFVSKDDYPDDLIANLARYNCVIIYNSAASNRISTQFGYSHRLNYLLGHLRDKRVILCHPAIPYGLSSYLNEISNHNVDAVMDAIIVNYEKISISSQYAAQAIFGGIAVTGKLPVSINTNYCAGTGISTPKTRLGYALPEMCGVRSKELEKIDAICKSAIDMKATPGCQVLVAKDNYIIYNKTFGQNTYTKNKATPNLPSVDNRVDKIYDIASVTKIAATTPAIMKLLDEGKINLDAPISTYLPSLTNTNKQNLTLREMLAHQAGLKNYIPFLYHFIDKKAMTGKFLTTAPTQQNTVKFSDKQYANPIFQFREATLSYVPKSDFEQIMPQLYMHKDLKRELVTKILESEVSDRKEYLYSDIGFILIQWVLEQISGESLDTYCRKNIYNRLGANNTDFLAYQRLNKDLIVPSSNDMVYRKSEIKGYVHDPTAFLLGGVGGNAGLFSTAGDLAKIMALFMNRGVYGDESYFSDTTLTIFARNTCGYNGNRRGLGFDKPEFDSTKINPVCPEASAESFGHSGFTGSLVWCDPKNNLIYIFLSNRTYPNEYDTKLLNMNIRTNIQSVIYKAVGETANSVMDLSNHVSSY
ncbi:beta-N-acetylglucosaminidase [Bacteroidia bacterium]|nr:beta-N-acetylglucosaminidase [Bacteroidia bacterium]